MTEPSDATIAFALSLAENAAEVIRPYFGQALEVETKPDDSPVSIADQQAERAMRDMIQTQLPNHSILGEEFGASQSASPYCWVLDPIDGTRAFLKGSNEWGTLIALCENGTPILGVMHQPITGDIWVGIKGRPTVFNGKECTTREHAASLTQAEISTTSANYFTPEQAKKFVALADQCNNVIKDGDCIAYGKLANGTRDIVVDVGLKPYDILALVPIIQGAGGIITATDGSNITLEKADTAIACSNKKLHAQVLKAV